MLDDRRFWIGVAAGVAVTSLRPHSSGSLARALRSILKTLIKAAALGSERARDLLAFVREAVEDAAVEAQSELHEAAAPTPSAPPEAAGAAKTAAGSKRVGSA